jgi:GATA-binding protein, other eukaryote
LSFDEDTYHSQHDHKDAEDTIAANGVSLHDALLCFPTLFSSDFGPSALLFPTPSVANPMNYGESVCHSVPTSNSFGIIRPTIELPP